MSILYLQIDGVLLLTCDYSSGNVINLSDVLSFDSFAIGKP